mmetsp:Transcript_25147/g.39729  ORF Transcript_25147/g.39729 Transcript_25147/m.39729 type:complete len:559 (-) Transcript_25147:161-1837(-)|eukprot:CAMPEP_0174321544 /NCGR_PEP_ID=MMETSP0810-20121108/10390_1 /TAXON_ID=73025 ORGANISM="Eutreptiella gymnastica-like, Strain CCMP1594" /NCGR_SAMPLE_ID=MMETSP0810 /ASSEMBLY_ACC=CAM_ASM_000659 /LENGTH=558 /DNA_ID=CAMNT_0015433031 /DNA_START=88 /DNA_END=1764 /DNA_ORIENTATION=-
MGNEPSCGYQIGRVVPNSPAHKAGLVPFFDFIQDVDGNPIEQRQSTFFREYLLKAVGRQIILKVFNGKTRVHRELPLTPNNNWGGQGLLGCSINWEDIEKAMTFGWHILDVQPNSNAQKAGLTGYRDYFVGMQAVQAHGAKNAQEVFVTMFQDTGDFHQRLHSRMEAAQTPGHPQYRNHSILFLVYDSVANDLREVICDFPLGCDIGNGYLHSIPIQKGDNRLPTIRSFYSGGQGNVPATPPQHAAPPQHATPPHHATPPQHAQPLQHQSPPQYASPHQHHSPPQYASPHQHAHQEQQYAGMPQPGMPAEAAHPPFHPQQSAPQPAQVSPGPAPQQPQPPQQPSPSLPPTSQPLPPSAVPTSQPPAPASQAFPGPGASAPAATASSLPPPPGSVAPFAATPPPAPFTQPLPPQPQAVPQPPTGLPSAPASTPTPFPPPAQGGLPAAPAPFVPPTMPAPQETAMPAPTGAPVPGIPPSGPSQPPQFSFPSAPGQQQQQPPAPGTAAPNFGMQMRTPPQQPLNPSMAQPAASHGMAPRFGVPPAPQGGQPSFPPVPQQQF